MSNSRPQAYQRLAELLIGSRIAMALRVVAEHQIADHLATGPQTAEALSSTTDFLPFVKPNLSHFLPQLHYGLTTNPAGIITRTMTQHGHQDTQESVANIA